MVVLENFLMYSWYREFCTYSFYFGLEFSEFFGIFPVTHHVIDDTGEPLHFGFFHAAGGDGGGAETDAGWIHR